MKRSKCNAWIEEYADQAEQELHCNCQWHRYHLGRKVDGIPGIMEENFLVRQSAQAGKRQKLDESPMLNICDLCKKEYKSSEAHEQNLKSTSRLTRASGLMSSNIRQSTKIKPLLQGDPKETVPVHCVEQEEDEDSSSSDMLISDSSDCSSFSEEDEDSSSNSSSSDISISDSSDWSSYSEDDDGDFSAEEIVGDVLIRTQMAMNDIDRPRSLSRQIRRIRLLLNSLYFYEQHQDMRMDIDNMSDEELLASDERMETVSTALSEEALLKCLKKSIYQPTASKSQATGSCEDGADITCCICQEEFGIGDEIGKLVVCKHRYHVTCITRWLGIKNWCPICKASTAPSQSCQ